MSDNVPPMSLVLKVSGPIWEGDDIFSESQTDLKILCRDGCVETHCSLLLSVTEFLSSLLASHCQECEKFTFGLPDFQCEEVKLLLDLLYCGAVSCSKQQLLSVHSLCRVLGLKPLRLTFKNRNSGDKKSDPKDTRQSIKELSEEKIQRTLDKTLRTVKTPQHNYENNSKSSGSVLKDCYICGVTVRGHHVLLDHLRLHDQSEGPFPCPHPACSEGTFSGVGLHKHFIDNHITKTQGNARPEYICDICEEQFSVFSQFKKHTRETHNTRPLKCADCSQRFNDKLGLRTHSEAKHAKLKIFPCDICQKQFSAARLLYQHRREIHELGEKRKAKCDVCGFISKGTLNLKKHMRTSHSEHTKKYPCVMCGRNFKSKYNLKAHERIHTGEAPHSCDGCGRRFKRATHLKQHSLRCSGRAPVEVGRSQSQSSLVNLEILLDVEAVTEDLS